MTVEKFVGASKIMIYKRQMFPIELIDTIGKQKDLELRFVQMKKQIVSEAKKTDMIDKTGVQ